MSSVKFQYTKLIYRNLLHFYTLITNDQKKKLRKQYHLQLHHKRIKHLGQNLIKQVKDLYSEKYKVLKREIESDTNKWKDISYLWIARIVDIHVLPKALYRFNTIPIKISIISVEIDRLILKL